MIASGGLDRLARSGDSEMEAWLAALVGTPLKDVLELHFGTVVVIMLVVIVVGMVVLSFMAWRIIVQNIRQQAAIDRLGDLIDDLEYDLEALDRRYEVIMRWVISNNKEDSSQLETDLRDPLAERRRRRKNA